jgi:membrane protease YdiL (CAAX protease family)
VTLTADVKPAESGRSRQAARTQWLLPALLLAGFAVALTARVAVGGPGPARSPGAGLLFSACLVAMAVATRTRVPLPPSALLWGTGGAVVLCAPVALLRLGQPFHDAHGFATWALVVVVVAVAEEVFLRGALYDAVRSAVGDRAAIVVGAVAFAALHVPLYGWGVVPLDFVVGLVLGELRRSSGTPAAPAVAHVGADMAGWFLR